MKDTGNLALPRKASRSGLAIFLAAVAAAVLAGPNSAMAFYDGYGGQSTQQKPRATTEGDTVVVDMNNQLRFLPPKISVKVGDTVEWRNIGSIPHTVTADPARTPNSRNVELPEGAKAFDSGWVNGGQSFRYTFDKPGVYRYVCLPHERRSMLGTVIVG